MSRLSRSIDLLVFNPPYVPTYTEEALQAQTVANIAGAWAGGMDGMQVTYALLDQLDVSNVFMSTRMGQANRKTIGIVVSEWEILPRCREAEQCARDSKAYA
jgi:methylase of polypeptide subunit release factors